MYQEHGVVETTGLVTTIKGELRALFASLNQLTEVSDRQELLRLWCGSMLALARVFTQPSTYRPGWSGLAHLERPLTSVIEETRLVLNEVTAVITLGPDGDLLFKEFCAVLRKTIRDFESCVDLAHVVARQKRLSICA